MAFPDLVFTLDNASKVSLTLVNSFVSCKTLLSVSSFEKPSLASLVQT